jgi:hypothetical protein
MVLFLPIFHHTRPLVMIHSAFGGAKILPGSGRGEFLAAILVAA